MATPFLRLQNFTAEMLLNSPGRIRLNAFDANGDAVDLSSGFTLQYFGCKPSSNGNPGGPASTLTSHVTATFDATGLTISWTDAQSATMVALLLSLQSTAMVSISNDSGTTSTVLGAGLVVYNNINGLN